MFVARSLPRILGILRPARGSLPGLKGPGDKREGEKGVGRGLSLGWATGSRAGLWRGDRDFGTEKGAGFWESWGPTGCES